MEILPMTREQFEAMRHLQVRRRRDWPATFTVSPAGRIWAFRRWGNTPTTERVQVRGLSSIIDAIADAYLELRGEGGRFFISEKGAFFSPQFSDGEQIAAFQII